MVLSDTTYRQGIIQDCEDLTGLGATGITGNTILRQTFTRSINQWHLKAQGWALEASHEWQVDDSNYSDLPRATTTLNASSSTQRDYTLPTAVAGGNAATFLRSLKFSVLNNSGDEAVLTQSDLSEAQLNEMFPGGGLPQYYKLIGHTIKLWPYADSSNCTLTAGLIGYFERTQKLFASTTADDAVQPAIPQPYHRILSLGASYDYGLQVGKDNTVRLRQELEVLKKELQGFFGGRNRDNKIRIAPRRENYN